MTNTLFLAFSFLAVNAAASAQSIVEQPSLTLNAAEKMVNACESLAKTKGWKVSIWVVDDNGIPIHMKHMQGAPIEGIQTAQMKAATSRKLAASTDPTDARSPLRKLTKDPSGQVMLGLTNAYPEAGGLPVIVDGKVAGAIGVSGVEGAAAAECAQAGVRAVSKP